jgi:hypothetical protein
LTISNDFPCLACGKTWTGHKRCHCASCHENFSSVSAFDRHRQHFSCLNPGSRGLVLIDGYWQWPEIPREALGRRLGATEAA